MKQGKHMLKQPKRRSSRRISSLLISVLLIAVFIVGGTVAFIVADTPPVENEFTPGSVECTVEETVSGSVKSSVKIKNTGNTDAYIRVAVIGNTVDADGKIIGSFDVSPYLAGTGWTKTGDYYYWGEKLSPNSTTGELLKQSLNFAGANVTIMADAIQADGVASTAAVGTAGKTPSQIAWAWTPAD